MPWKVYDGREPIEVFLNGNRPSNIQQSICPWVFVPCQHEELSDDNKDEADTNGALPLMIAEWKGLVKSLKHVTAETLKDLAVKYKYTSGKWMIFANSDQIDELWFTVAKAVAAGKLGNAAKVSSKKPDGNSHVICIYTKDFTKEDDVRRVEKGIRNAGILVGMQYKPDIYTNLGIYAKNKFGIAASVYTSRAVKKV
ncbi:UPF0696 protein C11orf68 homolog [Actinia tenebrosa]|uniref:UPF0696 protein C11orf68 homolog n=1 Tax=Actinia tenebrosa TaxID=6105 RepID=A0A6P8HWJ3_ACTTE|nr:UPF0696 protein C11orf68 homolog [Actinia tenebrosa]